EHDRARVTGNSAAIPTRMCEADPFAGLRGSRCSARVDERRNPGRDLVRQRTNDRDGEENCKAAANRLRKIRRVPFERFPLRPRSARARRPSNASFETKHPPPAVFQESLSFTQARLLNLILREKSRELSSFHLPVTNWR